MPTEFKKLIAAYKKNHDFRDEQGRTALIFFAEYPWLHSYLGASKYIDLLNKILKNNSTEAALNARQQDDYYYENQSCYIPGNYNTALISAAVKNNRPVVEAILNHNRMESVFNAKNRLGNTALIAAVINNHPDIITAILKYNSSDPIVNARDDGTKGTALIIAADNNRTQCVRAILSVKSSKSVLNARNISDGFENKTALIVAAAQGYADVVRTILEYNSSHVIINAHSKGGDTALIVAAAQGHVDVVRTILDYNSSDLMLNIQNNANETALSVAVTAGHADVIRAILEKNSSETVLLLKNKHAMPLLIRAIIYHQPNSVRALLDNAPLVGLLNAERNGSDALRWAEDRGTYEIKQIISQKMKSPRYLLEYKINALKKYGTKLLENFRSNDEKLAGASAIDLSNRLMAGLAAYYTAPKDNRQRKKDDFKTILHTGYHAMGQHIRPGIFHQLLLLIANLFRQISTSMPVSIFMGEAPSSFFFKTTRQQHVCSIANAFSKTEPGLTSSSS